jgi:hypothetical protein
MLGSLDAIAAKIHAAPGASLVFADVIKVASTFFVAALFYQPPVQVCKYAAGLPGNQGHHCGEYTPHNPEV